MKKKTLFFFIILLINITLFSKSSIDLLTEKASNSINEFFKKKYDVNYTIIGLKDYSNIDKEVLSQFYQLLVSKLENIQNTKFYDLLVSIEDNESIFNLKSVELKKINYFLSLKVIRNYNKLGLVISVFSKILDKVVFLDYIEVNYKKEEEDYFKTINYVFKRVGFSRIVELNVKKGLLNVSSFLMPDGVVRYFFLYDKKIDIYQYNKNRLIKIFTLKIKWKRPFYPNLERIGNIKSFQYKKVFYLILTINSYPYSIVYSFENNEWKLKDYIKFNIIDVVNFRNTIYLIGSNFVFGKNYYNGKIFYLPFKNNHFLKNEILTKNIAPFYSLGIDNNEEYIKSYFVINKDYLLNVLSNNLEIISNSDNKLGAELSVLKGKWLVTSFYSNIKDKLLFYKIDDSSYVKKYEENLNGIVKFISSGYYKLLKGFWVYLKIEKNNEINYSLQFWSKQNNE